jgi:hypothetical protein
MSNANQNANPNFPQQQNGKEQIDAADASTNAFPNGFQAIATAYGDYTKKSFEDTKSFVEKLSGARSFDKAVEIQTDFAVGFRDIRDRVAEDRRAVWRSCQASLQTIRRLCYKDDSDSLMRCCPAMLEQNVLIICGAFRCNLALAPASFTRRLSCPA